MAWEALPKKRMRVKTPTVRISKGGQIALSLNSRRDFLKAEDQFVELLYDREANRLAIKPIREERPGVFKISGGELKEAVISAKSQLTCIGYEFSSVKVFLCSWDEELGAIVFDLAHPITE